MYEGDLNHIDETSQSNNENILIWPTIGLTDQNSYQVRTQL